MKEQQEQSKLGLNSQDFRKFLSFFKTRACSNHDHAPQHCGYYHLLSASPYQKVEQADNNKQDPYPIVSHDRRRNPYGKLNRILYYAEYCQKIGSGCHNQECLYCHNAWEFNYHPLVFKTASCERFYDCCYQFCHKIHYADYTVNHKTQAHVIRFSQFFRFDIMTFKSIQCKKQFAHDKNSCLWYHNQKDYRRPNFEAYGHMECKKMNDGGCYDSNCPFSHNKIEQLYHPSRYKSKFCEKHELSRKNASDPNNQLSFKSLCPYGKFCSFAHDPSQISIQLIDRLQKNLEFYLYAYKTVWCPITTDHNRSNCVYAHNIQDYRRNPKQYHYEPIECPFWRKNDNIKSIQDAGCPEAMNCKKCHGWKEKQFHPVIYSKTKLLDSTQKTKEKSDSFTSSDGGRQKNQSPYFHDKKKSQMILKKIGTDFNGKSNIQTIVQTIYNKNNPQKQLYAPGAPFFKNNNNVGKIKSQSQKGDGGKAESDQKASQAQQRGSIMTTKSIAIKSKSNNATFQNDDEDMMDDNQLFKVFESGNQLTCDQKQSCLNITEKNDSQYGKQEKMVQKIARTVSKSVGCNPRDNNKNYYSKDVTDLLNSQIISVLRQKNINEIKLINMKEQDIRKIQDLTNSQKSLIIKKIILARDTARKTPTYEDILEKHFIRHRRLDILCKMKNKKVKQERLLLLDSEIKQLSFLSQSEKRILPKIIAQFKDNKEFSQLSEEIVKQINRENTQMEN